MRHKTRRHAPLEPAGSIDVQRLANRHSIVATHLHTTTTTTSTTTNNIKNNKQRIEDQHCESRQRQQAPIAATTRERRSDAPLRVSYRPDTVLRRPLPRAPPNLRECFYVFQFFVVATSTVHLFFRVFRHSFIIFNYQYVLTNTLLPSLETQLILFSSDSTLLMLDELYE
jgi:hypothetical protein